MRAISLSAPTRHLLTAAALTLLSTTAVNAQSLLPTYPNYDQYQAMTRATANDPPFISAAITPTWTDAGKGFDYAFNGRLFHFDIASAKATDTGPDPAAGRGRGRGRGTPSTTTSATTIAAPTARGRGNLPVQGGGGNPFNTGDGRNISTSVNSPDRNWTALSRDRNLFLAEPPRPGGPGPETQITTDGNANTRIINGTANIVYGEDLGQGTSIWWAPDSKRVAFYRFDESKVTDFTVLLQQEQLYNKLEIDPYPKVGTPGLIPDLLVYDLATKEITRIDTRDGKPWADETLGYYVYRPGFSPDSSELLFSRMNRKQNTLELCAANPETGKCHVLIHEERLQNWTDWQPTFEFLPDKKHFIWSSERTDFKHYYLYDLTGGGDTSKPIALTHGNYDIASLTKIVDDSTKPGGGQLFYMARDGGNYLKLQLHRVNLDGTGNVRLTDPAFLHTVSIAPDNQHIVDIYQTHDQPPASRLLDAQGKPLADIAKSDLTRWNELHLKPVEFFTFKTFDGTADLNGLVHFPTNFDPTKKYPLLLQVYGGPNTSRARENFAAPNILTELGFICAEVDARSLAGRGRKFSDPFYHHLGIIEMDDQAAGVADLGKRPYIDKARVGVYGTSYGGTSAATLILRYPDLFAAACSNSPVTDYRNYNMIYAERHNGQLSENKAGYDAATVMTYAPNLKGALLLYYGTADNNVHNSNAMQLIAALQKANKSFEVQVGPDKGHTSVNTDRMMEFFIQNLVMKK